MRFEQYSQPSVTGENKEINKPESKPESKNVENNQVIELEPGEAIGRMVNTVIEQMIELAKEENKNVAIDFNGIRLEVDRNSNPDSVFKYYESKIGSMSRSSKEQSRTLSDADLLKGGAWYETGEGLNQYETDTEGDKRLEGTKEQVTEASGEMAQEFNKRRQKQEEARESQNKVDLFIEKLQDLNFSDNKSVLNWFKDYESLIVGGVNSRANEVVPIFEAYGYKINENINEAFNKNDATNVAHYIVGQCLSTLKTHGWIHGTWLSSALERWEEKFK